MQSAADPICTVLIADDDATLSNVWRDLLSGAGFDVLTSNSGLKALDTIRYGSKVDVVLLDYNMPTLNGSQTLEHLKDQFPSVKPIGVSGVESSELPAAYREGVQKLLAKPVNSSDLIDAIRSVVGLPAVEHIESAKRSTNWVRILPWYALFLITSAAIFVLLQRATNELLSSQ
jgi:CheY-like chemotaxis protein